MKIFLFRNYQIVAYITAGFLAVMINILIFYLLANTLLGIWLANVIAFFIAVMFAYWSNTRFVFQTIFTKKNFFQFWSMRISGLFFDMLGLFMLIKLGLNEILAKCLVNVIIIVFNYICSKYYIYKSRKEDLS